MNKEMEGLRLFVMLVKDGCKWEGDVVSQKWSHCLNSHEADPDKVRLTLSLYEPELYKVEDGWIWIY